MQTNSSFDALLSARQLAELLNISTRTLWRLKSARKIPDSIRIGASVRWRAEDVREWIAEGCQSPIPRDNLVSRKV